MKSRIIFDLAKQALVLFVNLHACLFSLLSQLGNHFLWKDADRVLLIFAAFEDEAVVVEKDIVAFWPVADENLGAS